MDQVCHTCVVTSTGASSGSEALPDLAASGSGKSASEAGSAAGCGLAARPDLLAAPDLAAAPGLAAAAGPDLASNASRSLPTPPPFGCAGTSANQTDRPIVFRKLFPPNSAWMFAYWHVLAALRHTDPEAVHLNLCRCSAARDSSIAPTKHHCNNTQDCTTLAESVNHH